MPRLTTSTITMPAACAGIDEISRLVGLVTVKQPGAGAAHRFSVVTVPAASCEPVPISMAVAPPRLVPFTVIVPLVNGLVLSVHEICCPLGAPHTHPVPSAPAGTTPPGRVSVTVTGEFSGGPDEDAAT
jgi:hypothetical protein